MRFQELTWLYLLIIIVLPFLRWRGEKISGFSHTGLFPSDGFARAFVLLKKFILICAVTMLVASLAGPVTEGGEVERIGRGSSIVFVLDMSASMKMRLNEESPKLKWDLSEDVIARFVNKRCPKDRTALIGFGSMPILYSDFTYDCKAFVQILKWRGADLVSTVIGWPIHNAISMLYSLDTSGKAIVLVSDGDGSMEKMDEMAYWIKKYGIKFYWVAIGEDNAPNLAQFIDLLGSSYAEKYTVKKAEDFDTAFRKIDMLERDPIKYKEYRPLFSWKPYFLKAAFVASVLSIILAMFDFDLAKALKHRRKRNQL